MQLRFCFTVCLLLHLLGIVGGVTTKKPVKAVKKAAPKPKPAAPVKLSPKPTAAPQPANEAESHHVTKVKKIIVKQEIGGFIDETKFCYPNPELKMPAFYRSALDGAYCCRGNIIPYPTVLPATKGECAISASTNAKGIFDPSQLWCSYTCMLKKIKAIGPKGRVVPEIFFKHLSQGLGNQTRENVKAIMNKLGCLKEFKNEKFPCYTPLGFHKCYNDALEYYCSFGLDLSKVEPVKTPYDQVPPSCSIDGRQVMPECCHGKPLPWTVSDIIEAPRNVTRMQECMVNMQNRVCSASCFLNSAGVVDDSLEMDIDKFGSDILGLFPVVKPSIWMEYLGPTYVFFDEVLEELGAEIPTVARVCLFHDKIINFHEDKVRQYCGMSPEEVAEIISQNADQEASKKPK